MYKLYWILRSRFDHVHVYAVKSSTGFHLNNKCFREYLIRCHQNII